MGCMGGFGAIGGSGAARNAFVSATMEPIAFEHACARVLGFCTNPRSGWVPYDLVANHAREAGWFSTVTPWSLLYADALAGQVSIRHVADFSLHRREAFAALVRALPAATELRDADDAVRTALIDLCMFGFPGVWGPKVTKMAALYRPRTVPILDGYMAAAFGYSREAFSVGETERRDRIRRVLEELIDLLRRYAGVLRSVREHVAEKVPEVNLISDVRLLGIIIWTTQDDTVSRPKKPVNAWRDARPGPRLPLESARPVAI